MSATPKQSQANPYQVNPSQSRQLQPVSVVVVSDVVCPWCFIGKRRLEQAQALKPDIPVEVRYHPYFLNPWVPREGMDRDEYLTAKFGSPERYAGIAERVAAAAAADGLIYDATKMRRQPNTLDCHRLIHWAQAAGKAPAMKQRLMDLYFTEGGDLTDPAMLVEAAASVGLDAEEMRARLASDADVATVEQAAMSAKNAGIDGVPTYILAGALAVTGAQAPDDLAHVIEQLATNREDFLARQRAAAGA